MEDPFFGRLWDRFPQRSHYGPYRSHPHAAATVTPTKPEYDYWGAPKIKPKTFTVPVHGPPINPSPNSNSVTNRKSPLKPDPKNVISIPIDSEALNSSFEAKKTDAPRMDETSAATKMQSAFRGFSTRKGSPLKNLRVIRDVKADADAIRRRLVDRQVVESILQNEKERLKITEEIMSLLLKLDAIQGVNSFVRESRKAVIRELLNLEEMVDAIIAGKSIEGTAWMGAEAAEDDNYGEEMASVKENGEAPFSDGGPNNEEVRDEELPERGSNEEEVLDGVKLASASDSKVQEVSLFSDEIEIPNIQIESSNHTDDNSMGTGGQWRGLSPEAVARGEPVDFMEKKLEEQELEPYDEEAMKDPIDGEKYTEGASSCEGRTGEKLRALGCHSIPCPDEEVMRHSTDEEEFPNRASVRTCKRLKALDCPQVEAETIQADEQQRQCEGMQYEETGEVTEAVAGQDANVEEDFVKVNDENGKLKMLVGDLFKKNKLQNKLIKNLTRRIAQLEEQISKSKRKKTGDKKKKMKETENSTTGRRKTE